MIIIPARLASTRFPKKVLADIGGLPMVVRTAQRVREVDEVMVAADDEEVVKVCTDYGIPATLTSTTHKSGTDRVNECAQLLALPDDEPVLNVQADEPFIETEVVSAVLERIERLRKKKDTFVMVSCYNTVNAETARDPNLVKVVLNARHEAVYFSRAPIPYNRSGAATYFGHIGIYGFTAKSLHDFCALDDAPIEDVEKLEQLRALYHALPISMVKVTSTGFGIDTPEDLKRALEIFGIGK